MFPQVILFVSPLTLILILLIEVLFGASDINKRTEAEAKRKEAEAKRVPETPEEREARYEAMEEQFRAQRRLELTPSEYEDFLESRRSIIAYAKGETRENARREFKGMMIDPPAADLSDNERERISCAFSRPGH